MSETTANIYAYIQANRRHKIKRRRFVLGMIAIIGFLIPCFLMGFGTTVLYVFMALIGG